MGKRRGHPNSTRAGAKNLAKWQAEVGHFQQNITHGATSATIRQRYSDKRTVEGKRLENVIAAVEDALGGPLELTAFQQIKIGLLRSKLIRFFQFSDYIDKQLMIVDKLGNPLKCLAEVNATENGILQVLKDLENSLNGKRPKPDFNLKKIIQASESV